MTNDTATYKQLSARTRQLLDKRAPPLDEEEVQADLLRLIHELETTHIDLEVQKEELNKALRDLDASGRELFELYESAPVGYMFLSPKGIVRKANAMARGLLGTDPRGQGISSFILPDDWGIWFRKMPKRVVENRPLQFDLRLKRPADSPAIVEIHLQPFYIVRDQLEGWQMAMADVTDQRRDQARLRHLHEQLDMAANAAHLGVWNFDTSTNKVVWNRQLYHLLGLEPADGPEDRERFLEFVHPDDRQGVLSNVDALLKSPTNQIQEDFRIVRPDGTIRWLASRGQIYRDATGRPTHICGINFDITRRKEKEAQKDLQHLQLATALKEAQRLNEEQSQFAYAISHDLKEPMRAIHNYADFLVEDLGGNLSGEQKTYIDGLKQAVDQGTRLIDDLLAFSRLEQNTDGKETVDLAQLVEQVRSVLDPNVQVDFRVTARLPTIHGNRTLLRQIMQNLLSNAIKFNHHASKTVTVGWRTAPADHIDIFVMDNGIGIDPKYHKDVYRIFKRLHTQSEFPGTGIGLAIVKKAAAILGGTLSLESEPGKGSTFTVRLPMQ